MKKDNSVLAGERSKKKTTKERYKPHRFEGQKEGKKRKKSPLWPEFVSKEGGKGQGEKKKKEKRHLKQQREKRVGGVDYS